MTADEFCALSKDDEIDKKIKQAEANLKAARSATEIKKQSPFQKFDLLPAFDIGAINAILQKSLSGLEKQVMNNIQQHLNKLGQGSEAWISDGMQKIKAASTGEDGEICPFCTQSLSDVSIIEHYAKYFSDAYEDHKESIKECENEIAHAHDSTIQTTFVRTAHKTLENVEFWKKYMEVPAVKIDTGKITCAWKAAREPILAALRTKLASPLEKMDLSKALKAVATYDKHREAIKAISQDLLNCNSQINELKEESINASVDELTDKLGGFNNIRARYGPDNAELCKTYLDEQKAKKVTENERAAYKKKLNEHRTNIFKEYGAAINEYLKKFNAGFQLSNIAQGDHRGGISCKYGIKIKNTEVPLTADSGASFKNTLSAGDRNTLALAFFFSSLDQDQKLAKKIVVIDDPMTSLDEHRTTATIQVVRDLVNKTQQVIILSHSKSFLCKIWEKATKSNSSALEITRNKRSSIIKQWDVNQDCITAHDIGHDLIKSYIDNRDSEKQRAVAFELRLVLERFLRVAYPDFFKPGASLGNFTDQCQEALSATPILSKIDTKDLIELKAYANEFHHDTNPAYKTVSINGQELAGYCERILKFTKRPLVVAAST